MPRLLSVLLLSLLTCIISVAQQSPLDIKTLLLRAQNGEPSPDIVRELAKTDKAISCMLAIALTPHADSGNREIAVTELAKINSADSADALAQLLAPHMPWTLRHNATIALANGRCDPKCVRSILFYLYRFSRGERPRVFLPTMSPEQQKQLDNREAELNVSLKKIASQHGYAAFDALVTVYGLGTEQPSQFAIQMVRDLNLKDGCPYLLRTEHIQQVVKAPELKDTTAAVQALNCR